jgi:short-subunit dehydrogenase
MPTLARTGRKENCHVIAVARRGDRLQGLTSTHRNNVTAIALDLTCSQTEPTIDAVIRHAGGLDVLVNNAGYGLTGSIEQCDDSAARAQFDVNFFAPLTVLRAALPASKSALQLISEALTLELAPAGVHVTTIHPGHFATEFKSSAHVVAPDATYAATVGTTLSDSDERPAKDWGDPSWVVDAVLAVVAHPQPPRRVAVGRDAVLAMRATLHSQLTELAEWQDGRGLFF